MTETIELGGAPERRGGVFLLVVQGAEEMLRVPIEGTLLLGKHQDNDVVLDSTGVSRYHLEIRAERESVVIRDVGSKNGTFYNGARITEVRVGGGAVLRIGGPAGLEVRIEEVGQPVMAPSAADHFGPLLGRSLAMRSVFAVLERAAPSNATILLLGETGTGKEVAAGAIHAGSPRAAGPFVVVDCAAIPHQLIESELFGHQRGAFTDAHTDRAGAFEAAHGGTMFLDEIGELPLDLQPKLLRVVETRTVQRLGDKERRPADVRLIAATHRELDHEVSAGRFRRDLYFRLAVVTIRLPPLRERGEDVVFLAEHLLGALGQPKAIDFEGPLRQALLGYAWPGNVRELRNAIERALHLGAEYAIPSGPSPAPAPSDATLDDPDLPFKEAKDRLVLDFERAYVTRLMDAHAGNISAAARAAGIDRNYLYRLLKKHRLG